MSKMYGSYSDDDLNDWERLPLNAMVLTSSGFGAWLYRRDENKRKQENIDVLDKIKADVERIEISGRIDEHSSFIRSGEHIKHMVIDIIDKYRGKQNE